MFSWVYRGEGNQHIVVSNEQKHIVYRMFKRLRNGQKKTKVDYDLLRDSLQRCLQFTTNIMLPLFHPDYLHCGSLVEIPECTAHVIKNCLVNRPPYREDKELDVKCPYVLQMPDYCHVTVPDSSTQSSSPSLRVNKPVYTVEIKPKWAFLPVTENISESRKVKYSVCRFCMHQRLKLAKGKWKIHSRYCPIDLFSGDVDRMKHALRMLFDVPQNNLRLFKNGTIIWNDILQEKHGKPDVLFHHEFSASGTEDIISLRSRFDDFLDLLVKTLLHKFESDHQPMKSHSHSPANKKADTQTGLLNCSYSTSVGSLPVIIHKDMSHLYSPVPCSQWMNECLTYNGHRSEVRCALGHCDLSSGKHLTNHTIISKAGGFVNSGSSNYSKFEEPRMSPQYCRESTYTEKDPEKPASAVGLPKGCVLYQVRKTQQLDDLDIEGIIPLYKAVKMSLEDVINQEDNSNIDPYHFNGPYDGSWWSSRSSSQTSLSEELGYAVRKIKEYLVSRSAKDCSIMISLQQCAVGHDLVQSNTSDSSTASNSQLPSQHPDWAPQPRDRLDQTGREREPLANTSTVNGLNTIQGPPSGFMIEDRHGVSYKAVVGVIDLDPKRFEKIQQYMSEDEEIVNCYLSYCNKNV